MHGRLFISINRVLEKIITVNRLLGKYMFQIIPNRGRERDMPVCRGGSENGLLSYSSRRSRTGGAVE